MCGFGYGHFVNDMLVNQTGGRLAGYSSACGQMASSAGSATKIAHCIGNASGTLKPKAFSVITYNAGLHDCDTNERVHADAYRVNLKAELEIRQLHEKMDHQLAQQWNKLAEMQQIQIEILQERLSDKD
jgi:hypothetical protein